MLFFSKKENKKPYVLKEVTECVVNRDISKSAITPTLWEHTEKKALIPLPKPAFFKLNQKTIPVSFLKTPGMIFLDYSKEDGCPCFKYTGIELPSILKGYEVEELISFNEHPVIIREIPKAPPDRRAHF